MDSTPISPWLAAVVQLPVEGFVSNQSVDATMGRNAARMAAVIDQACHLYDPAPRLFVFPALGLVGAGRRPADLQRDHVSMPLDSPRLAPLYAACARNGAYAVTSTPERPAELAGHTFHTGFMLGPDGLVLRAPKAQAYSAAGVTPLRNLVGEYEAAFGAGSIYPVAETPIGRIGILVEREVQVPETARLLAARGADLIVNLSAEGAGALERFPAHEMRRAAAYANAVYLLAASFPRILFARPDGGFDEDAWGGIGSIIGPDGEVIAHLTSPAGGHALGWIDIEARRRLRDDSAIERTPVSEFFPGAPGARPAADLVADPASLPQVHRT